MKDTSQSAFAMPRLAVLAPLMALPAAAQNRVNVVVDLNKAINMLIDTSLGVQAPCFDGNSIKPAGLPCLRAAGVATERFPGNHGVADLYRWFLKTSTGYKGSAHTHSAGNDLAQFPEVGEQIAC